MCKLFLKKGTLLILSILLIMLISISFNSMAQENKIKFVIGSASPGSNGYIMWEACAYLVNKYSSKLECSSISTAGSTEDVVLLDQGKVQLGHGTSLDVVSAWAGKSPFKKKMQPWQALPWNFVAQPMVALASSDLEKLSDLEGKSVSLIKKGSGTESMYRLIFEEYGILDKIRKNYLSFNDSKNALLDGLIVAFPSNFAGGKEPPVLSELVQQKPYKLLKLDLEVMKRVNDRNKGVTTVDLQNIPVPKLGLVGLTTAKVSDEAIYEFVKAVLEHTDELHTISSVSGATTLEYAISGFMPDYPVHPGAAKYFKEKGIWREELIIGER